MGEKIAGVTDDAVEEATGEAWSHWLTFLDEENGTDIDHKARVARLESAGVTSGWWQQKLAVGYEHERGLREAGQTADAGYEIGVQRTLPLAPSALWDLVVSPAGVEQWLGDCDTFELEAGAHYETADGVSGEIRTLSRGERIRFTWAPPDREDATTVQLYIRPSSGTAEKAVLQVHQEYLDDQDEREAKRVHWHDVLDDIETSLA